MYFENKEMIFLQIIINKLPFIKNNKLLKILNNEKISLYNCFRTTQYFTREESGCDKIV